MKYSEYIEAGLMAWPESIRISDGEVLDDEGGFFPALSEIWNAVEEKEEKKGPLQGLMSWAIFSGLHKLARARLEEGHDVIQKKDVDRDYVHEKFNESFYAEENDWNTYHSRWLDDYRTGRQNKSTHATG